jgi:hypothetical protein
LIELRRTWLAFNTRTMVLRIAAALVMGAAVCAMHYTGMSAAEFICTTANRSALPRGTGIVSLFDLPAPGDCDFAGHGHRADGGPGHAADADAAALSRRSISANHSGGTAASSRQPA